MMATAQESGSLTVPIGILGVFTSIGLFAGGQTADPGVAVTWFWMGIGLAAIYFLYRLIVTLEAILERI